jgi:methylglyoxal synthase
MPSAPIKRIALIAHDSQKQVMVDWVRQNRAVLERHDLCATGTTGARLEKELGLKIHKYKSGPLGGDQQIGARIAEGKIDFLIFLWDPLNAQPHDVDVKALLRLAVVYNVATACNLATADCVIKGC